MSKIWWVILFIILALLMVFIIWPIFFAVQKSEAPTAPNSTFKGPVGEPYMKGPIGPPPSSQ